jgi:hypothetical protein
MAHGAWSPARSHREENRPGNRRRTRRAVARHGSVRTRGDASASSEAWTCRARRQSGFPQSRASWSRRGPAPLVRRQPGAAKRRCRSSGQASFWAGVIVTRWGPPDFAHCRKRRPGSLRSRAGARFLFLVGFAWRTLLVRGGRRTGCGTAERESLLIARGQHAPAVIGVHEVRHQRADCAVGGHEVHAGAAGAERERL